MSDVTFHQFCLQFASDLEITDEAHLAKPLKELAQFDSMGKINASLTIEQLFNFQISYEALSEAEDLQALYSYCVEQSA
ncbi:MAG: hypothetical protein ACRC24_03930 [Vibrionaceae bacterium]